MLMSYIGVGVGGWFAGSLGAWLAIRSLKYGSSSYCATAGEDAVHSPVSAVWVGSAGGGTAALWCMLFAMTVSVHAWMVQAGVLLLLVAAAWVDAKTQRIPNPVTAAAALVGGAVAISGAHPILHIVVAGCTFAGGVGLAMVSARVLGRTGLGMGDIKLVAVLALWIGPSALWVAYLGVVAAAVIGIGGMVTGAMHRSMRVPLAPFILAGAVAHWLLFPNALSAILAQLSAA